MTVDRKMQSAMSSEAPDATRTCHHGNASSSPTGGTGITQKCSPSSGGLQARRNRLKAVTISTNLHSPSLADQRLSMDLMSKYSIEEALGRGACGVVHRAVRKADKKECALKICDTDFSTMSGAEFAILCSIDHPNIIKTYDYHMDTNSVVLVQELFPAPPLKSIVRSAPNRKLEEAQASSLFSKLLQAVDYLHQRRIVHRDIKPDNILVAQDYSDLKLIDFNTAHCLRDGASLTPVGTKSCAAPEVILGESPSEANDIWAVGLCLHYMVTGTLPPYQKLMAAPSKFGQSWLDVAGLGFHSISDSCKQMLRRCLAWKKQFRPAAMTLLVDGFVSDVQRNAGEMHEAAASIGIVFVSSEASPLVKLVCKRDNSKAKRFLRRRSWEPQYRGENLP